MNNNYLSVIKEIEDLITKHCGVYEFYSVYRPYDYKNDKNSKLYERIFEFSQLHLDKTFKNHYNISAFFYFTDFGCLNAFADSYYIIGIDRGVIELMLNNCFAKEVFHHPELAQYDEMRRFINEEFELGLNFVLFAFSFEFIYYHEFAHLLQFKNKDSSPENLKVNEYSLKSNYNKERHLQEMDADYCGCFIIVKRVLEIYRKLDKNSRTQNNLYKIIALALSCVYSFCRLMEDDDLTGPIYFEDNEYPHSYVRCIYICATILNGVHISGDLTELDEDIITKIVLEAVKISNLFFDKNNDFEQYNDSLQELDDYLAEKKEEYKTIPYLAGNNTYPFQF